MKKLLTKKNSAPSMETILKHREKLLFKEQNTLDLIAGFQTDLEKVRKEISDWDEKYEGHFTTDKVFCLGLKVKHTADYNKSLHKNLKGIFTIANISKSDPKNNVITLNNGDCLSQHWLESAEGKVTILKPNNQK